MNLTIVIPTRNRSAKLRAGLEALAAQTDTDFRVIIVDDGSDAHERRNYETLAAEFSPRVQLLQQANTGISGATNAGIAAAPDGLLLLMDDDIVPASTHVAQHRAHHAAHPDSIVCGTAHTEVTGKSGPLDAYKVFMEAAWDKHIFDGQQGLIVLRPGRFTVTAANMSFAKSTFDQLGGFDTTLRDCQDFEFGLRALRRAIPLFFDKRIRAVHNDAFSLHYYARRQRSYQLNTRKVIAQYPEFSSYFDVKQPPPPAQLHRRLVYGLLRRPAIVRFVEHSRLFAILPQRLRYRVYGITLAALSFSPDAL